MTAARKTKAERLIERLRREFPALNLPEGAYLASTHSNGSDVIYRASWWAYAADGHELRIGSYFSMTQLLGFRHLELSHDNHGMTFIELVQ